MRKEVKFIFLLFLLGIFSVNAYGAKRYWVAANDSTWNSTTNWSATSGGVGGASVPGSSDTAYFDGGSVKNDTFDINVSIKRLEISSGYTGTIVQGTKTLTIGTSGAVLSGGIFSGGSASITASGAFTISGTSFTSTSGTFSTSANFTISSGSFLHNNGKLKFTASNTITGSDTLYRLEFAPAATATYTIASGTILTVTNTLSTSGANAVTLNTGTIYAKGDVDVSANTGAGGGNATIIINGTGTQRLIGSSGAAGRLCNVRINKSAADSLLLSNAIAVAGNWTDTTGLLIPGTSSLIFLGTKTITENHTLNNVYFTGTGGSTFTIASGEIMTVGGNLFIQGTVAMTINTGTIYAKGNITSSNTSTGGGGNATIVINGTSNQTFTGSGTAGQGHFPKITIDKGPSDGTLTLASIISVNGDWIYTKGIVSPGTSTVVLYGTGNLDGQETGSSAMMSFNSLGIAGTITLTGNIDLNNTITIGNGATLSAGSNSIYVGGHWNNNNGTWTYGTSTVIFDGSTYRQIRKTISGTPATETFYNLTFNRRAGSQTLGSVVTVNNVLTLTRGHVKSSSTNYLLLIDGATLSGGSDSAYVHGPVRKTGDDAFTFPLGDTTLADTAYHPLAMTAPSSTGDQFEASYFATNYPVGDSLVDSLASVSQCEYWTMERKAGSSTPIVYLSWNAFCDNTSYSEMRVAEWNGVKWLDKGQGSISVNASSGTVAGSLASSFSINPVYLTIGYRNAKKSYTQVQKSIDGGYSFTDGNILYYRYNEEYKDANGFISYQVIDVATNAAVTLFGNATTVNVPVRYGVNDLKMDLYTAANTPLAAGMYLLVVTNDKNETFQLRFNKN